MVRPPLLASGIEPAGASGIEAAPTASLAARIAETALWLGRTRPGRALSRLAPARVRTALKERLR